MEPVGIPRGPIQSWAANVPIFGCEWQLETTWSDRQTQWDVLVRCESERVGQCSLDTFAWGMGACVLIDPAELVNPDSRAAAEVRLSRSLVAAIAQSATREEQLEFLVELRCFGLAQRVLRALDDRTRVSPLIAGKVAKGLGDDEGVKRSRSNVGRWQTLSMEDFERGVDEVVPLSAEERALCRSLAVPTVVEVTQAIRAAFKDAKLPQTETELTRGGIDGPYVIKHFFGRSRADVDEKFLVPSLHMEDFLYMTPQAVQYYLPCLLKLILDNPSNGELWSHLSGFLKLHLRSTKNELTLPQCSAVALWAEYLYQEFLALPPLLIKPQGAKDLAELYHRHIRGLT